MRKLTQKLLAIGSNRRRLAVLNYQLMEENHREDPEMCPPPCMARAKAAADHYVDAFYGTDAGKER